MSLRETLEQMDNRTLYLNLVLSQLGLFILGWVLYFVFLSNKISLREIYQLDNLKTALLSGLIFAGIILILDIFLTKILPEGYFDDGGVNERIFRDVNVAQIALISIGVALVEEWLFRAVLQNLVGLFWASIIFAGIHVRYFGRFFYAVLIIATSFGFGYLYVLTGSIWSVILAHFIIDFCMGVLIRYGLLTKKEDM